MQLAAFDDMRFTLGHASMAVNEGLPHYVVAHMEKRHHLEFMTVGILGMAFKGDSDDTRSSLAYKLKRILSFKCERGAHHRPVRAHRPDLLPLEEVVERSDLLVLARPTPRTRGCAPTRRWSTSGTTSARGSRA